MAILGAEELLREGHWCLTETLERWGSPAHDASALLEFPNLFEECEVDLLCLEKRRLELLVPSFQALDLQALPLS